MLNPFRQALGQAAAATGDRTSPFRAEAEAALAGFRATRHELERQVRRGDLTVKVARERASEAARGLRAALFERSETYSPTPHAFADRLTEAGAARRRSAESPSLEALQRETNRLLRDQLIEAQIQARSDEFAARAFARPIGGGSPAPTLDGLLAFDRWATEAGDDAAREWSRRQLEEYRPRTLDPADVRRIDRATDRPDRVNLRLVAAYLETLANQPAEGLDRFAAEAIAARDASACVACFALARQTPPEADSTFCRTVLARLGDFPDAALRALRALEADARADDAHAARAEATFAVLQAEQEANLAGLQTPTDRELESNERVRTRPLAQPGAAIGLTLDRRGALESDEATGGR